MKRQIATTLALGALGALGVGACGPSFQVVYEGDARFEHCYALDETPQTSMEEKTDCWTTWIRSYTYGQTRNRVDYAAARAQTLRNVPKMPTDEALMSAADPSESPPRLGHDEPLTTNAFAPPPKTLNEGDAGSAPANPARDAEVVQKPTPPLPIGAVIPPSAPREPCTDRCRSEWQACRAACTTKCGACDHIYGGCMKRCF
jgi:hypothetical protein